MLKEQLQQLRKSTRTLLHTKKSLIKFIQDEDVDTYVLFTNIPFNTQYTGKKSLNFDRHQLSEREERKFNSKFAPFLKGLISKMSNDGIDILLEYLLRVYNIDTFNPRELVFLLLPFKKYFDQLKIISQNISNQFLSLKSYSISSIARIIYKDRYLFLDFIEYFKNYNALEYFLDKVLDELIEIVKVSEKDYLTEFFQIISHMIESKNTRKALSLYHRMKSYLNTQDFVDIFLPYYSIDTINMNVITEVIGKYEDIFRSGTGRELLNNPCELHRYFNYLRTSHKTPKEFNENEFHVLLNIFFNENLPISNFSDLILLFRSIEPKDELMRYIYKHNAQKIFIDEMNDYQKVLLVNDGFDISLLTPINFGMIIKKIEDNVFKSNYEKILEKTLSFVTFDSIYFDRFVFFDDLMNRDALFKHNYIKLADKTSTDLSSYFIKCDLSKDQTALSYILTHSTSVESLSILNMSKLHMSNTIMTDLSVYILKNFNSLLELGFDIDEFVVWTLDNKFEFTILNLIQNLSHLVNYDILYKYTLHTSDEKCLVELEKRNKQALICKIIESCDVSLVLMILKRYGAFSVLESIDSDHSLQKLFLDTVIDHHIMIFESITSDDKIYIIELLLSNINDSAVLSVIMIHFDTLITFRKHNLWIVAKSIIIECANKNQSQSTADYILDNFELFGNDDEDLFYCILQSKNIFIDILRFKDINKHPHAATFIHLYISCRGCDDILPVLPFIAPLLIKYKKNTVEILFNMFGDIMCVYIRDILDLYPEMSHVLLKLDPKQTLEEICSNFNIGHLKILQQIVDSKICKDLNIFKKIYKVYSTNVRILESTDVISFVRFCGKSFAGCQKTTEYLKKFIELLYKQNTPVFYSISNDVIQTDSEIFSKSVDSILQSNVEEITTPVTFELLCVYFENNGTFEDSDGSLFDKILNSSSDSTSRLLSLIACNEYGNVDHAVDLIFENIKKNQKIVLCLNILLEILKVRSEIKDIYENEILSIISVLAENKDETISDVSKKIIESIQ